MKRLYSTMIEEYNTVNNNSIPLFEEDTSGNFQLDLIASKKIILRNKEAIKTYCRIRPVENDAGIYKISDCDSKCLLVSIPEDENLKTVSEKFIFSQIFDATVSQVSVFESTCLSLVEDLIHKRKSGLIFAFGLTNSGKTYTITGKPDNPGILPLTLRHITDEIEKLKHKPELLCNFTEVYNEEVFDLLAEDKQKKKVHIKEKDKTFYIKGITDKKINSIVDLSESLNAGVFKKTMACTNLNSESSRSHTVFKIILRWNCLENDELVYEEASLSIVDLAGSERANRAETSGKELQQACKINQSLMALGKCLKIMKDNSAPNCQNRMMVPFRDSKLTKLFQQYLTSEDSNIIMITNINPCRDDFRETCMTLTHACTAREIKPVRSKVDHTNSQFSNNLKNREKKKKKESDFPTNNCYQSSDNSYYSDDDLNKLMLSNPNISHSFITDDSKFKKNLFVPSQPNNNSNTHFFEEINELKNKLDHMNKKFHDTQRRCENLEKKNNVLNYEIIQLKYQFDLNQTNCRYDMLKMLSNQMCVNSQYEDFMIALERKKNEQISKHSAILINPNYRSASKKEHPAQVEIKNVISDKPIEINFVSNPTASVTVQTQINENMEKKSCEKLNTVENKDPIKRNSLSNIDDNNKEFVSANAGTELDEIDPVDNKGHKKKATKKKETKKKNNPKLEISEQSLINNTEQEVVQDNKDIREEEKVQESKESSRDLKKKETKKTKNKGKKTKKTKKK